MPYVFYWLIPVSISCVHDGDAVPQSLRLALSPYIDIPGLRIKSGVKPRSSSRILKKNT